MPSRWWSWTGPSGTRRHDAKSDPIHATRAAREALGRGRLAQPRAAGQRATAASLRALARRVQALDREIAEHTRAITSLVRAWRPDLLRRCGVGPIVAATVLCAWSHAGRCRTDAAFAMLGGAARSRLPLGRPSATG